MSNYTPAMESVFADADQSAQVILDAVRAGIDTKITTVEDAQTLYLDLSKEAAKFNECLRAISNLSAQLDAGNIDKEEAVASISPYVKELKDNCTALKIAGTKTTIDDNDITEEEIAILREVITGAMSIAEHHVREMQSKVVDYKDGEPPATESAGILASIATEASVVGKIRQSTEAKTAKELYKQAKRLYSMGSKEKAKEYLTKAQKLYEACLKKVMKEGKFFETERTEGLAAGLTGGLTMTDRYKKTVSARNDDVNVRAYFEDRIDACRALMLQWTNKAGAKTFAETKAQLKAERKSEKASIRTAKKEAKEKAKADKAAAKEAPSNENWLDFATESTSNIQSDFELEAALEALDNDAAFELADAALEGQNIDALNLKRENMKKAKAAASEAKKLMKAKDFAGASKKWDEAAGLIDKMIKDINELDPSVGSAVLGFFTYGFHSLISCIAIPTGISTVTSAVTSAAFVVGKNGLYKLGLAGSIINGLVASIRTLVDDIKNLINILNKLKNKDEKISATDFNRFVRGIINIAEKTKKSYQKMSEVCKKKANSSEPASESSLLALLDGTSSDELDSALEAMLAELEADDNCEDESSSSEDEDEDLEELATEAAVAVMLAEDGIVD